MMLMDAMQIIQSVEKFGCHLQAKGENVLILNSNRLPDPLKEEIRTNKAVVLKILERDYRAKNVGFIIGLPGELYTRTLSKQSCIYIEQIGSEWQAWRETYQSKKEKAVSYKFIFASETFELVVLKAKSYFDYIERKRSE